MNAMSHLDRADQALPGEPAGRPAVMSRRALVATLAVIAISAIVALIAVATDGSGSPSAVAGRFIDTHSADFTQVRGAMDDVQGQLNALGRSRSAKDADAVAASGEQLLNAISVSSTDLYSDIDNNDPEMADETFVGQGASDLAGATTDLVTATGAPTALKLEDVGVEISTARYEWNQGVAALWKLAGRADPPTA